jgi:ribonuclease G
MSKELVVSATRHETRIAILEDDSVVEIYYQREKEYSLAGSIHKGKVTRVLPGMQSAFVDIGLERDAFLYVSDFFEDNEEYDKVVSIVEDKVLKLEKSPERVLTEMPAIENDVEPLAEVALEEAEPVVVQAVSAETKAVEPRPDRDARDRDGRRGRGRRGRRRRGSGPGSGIPESKFYTPRRDDAEPVAAPEHVVAAEEDEDFPVLPGESLAKYSAPESRESSIPEAIEEPEAEEEFAVAAAEAEPKPEPEPTPVEPELAKPAAEPPPLPASVIAAELPVELPAEPEEPIVIKVEVEGILETVEEPETAEEEPYSAETEISPEEAMEAAEGISDGETTDEGEAEIQEDEGPEPARIPTSLTAALREQGNRFPHRLSRRARRKMRGGGGYQGEHRGPAGTPPEAIAAPEAAEVPVETPAPLAPPENRPQRGRGERVDRGGERNERGERSGRPDRAERGERPERERTERERPERERPERERTPSTSISELLREGQEIIVQIAKEPLGQKGARITSHIALPGRFLVYMPTVDHVGVSRKIPSDDERQRLKRILQTNRAGMTGGFIVRTAGEGKSEEELRADMHFLYNLWLDIRQKAEKKPAPLLLHHDLDLVQRILRDQLTSSFKTVWVDNEEAFESVLRFVERFQPALVSRVKLYTRTNPIFDEFNITAELEKALRPKVWLKSGGYIVINQTEALVAIDVNTGKYVGKSNRLEDTIVRVNTDAIREIVRQIRLRDLGGIIVVDFIDMDERKNRQKVMQALEEAMRVDRAPYKILAFNDFGLVAITRKRVKQSLERTLCSPCPVCEGAGYVKSPQTVVGEILQEAQKMAKQMEGDDVLLRVNPEVAKLLKSNRNDYLQEIEEIVGRTVMVKSDPTLHQTKFDLA